MKTRIFPLALALVMVLGLAGCDSSAQPTAGLGESPTVQATPSPELTPTPEATTAPVHDLSTAADDGFVIEAGVLKDYTGPNSDVFIPEGVVVVQGLSSKGGIRSIYIPSSVKMVDWSFRSCSNLESVTFAAGKDIVIENSFHWCKNLTNVAFAEGITEIFGFRECEALTSITFPDGVTKITGFEETGLTEVTFPESVTEINGFSHCNQLTDVTFPESVTSISGFESCEGLSSVTIYNGEAWLGTLVHDDGYVAKQTFRHCPNLTIHAPAGGAVEEYAARYNIPFSPL